MELENRLEEIIKMELETIRPGSPFTVLDLRVFAAYDGLSLAAIPGSTLARILNKICEDTGAIKIKEQAPHYRTLWVRV